MNERLDKNPTNLSIVLIIVVLWAVFFLSGTFEIPLMPPDEPKYAFASRQMIESGDFITPTFNCKPRFDKPPLIYWLIALSYKFFGFTDWAARIPSVIMSLGVMIFIYLFGKKKGGERIGILSVVVFSGFIHPWVMGRAVAPEMALIFFETAAVYFFFISLENSKRIYTYIGYMSLAFSFLAKGPVGIIIPLSVVFLYFIFKKGFITALKSLISPVGIIIFVFISLPWYMLMIDVHGYQYLRDFFLFHNIERFTGKARQHPFKWHYYFPVMLGSVYLWLPFLPEVWRMTCEKIRERGEELFYIIWFLFVMVFFTVSANKLHNYILIAYPPLAVLIAVTLDRIKHTGLAAKILFAGSVLIEFSGIVFYSYTFKEVPAFIIMGGAAMVVLSLIIIFVRTSMKKIFALVMCKAFCLLLMVIFFFVSYKQDISRAYAFLYAKTNIEKKDILFYKAESQDLVFYANRCIKKIENKDELLRILQESKRFVLFVREKDMDEIKGIKQHEIIGYRDIKGRKNLLIEISADNSLHN